MSLQQEVIVIAQKLMDDIMDERKTNAALFDEHLSLVIAQEISVNGAAMPRGTLTMLKEVLAVFVVRERLAQEYEKIGVSRSAEDLGRTSKGTSH